MRELQKCRVQPLPTTQFRVQDEPRPCARLPIEPVVGDRMTPFPLATQLETLRKVAETSREDI